MKSLNIPKSIKDMEQKTPGPCNVTSKCHDIPEGETSPSPYKSFHKVEERKHFSTDFMRPALQTTKPG